MRTQILLKPYFRKIGKRSIILKPLQLDEVKSITIEDDVYIAENIWLMGNDGFNETIRICEGTTIGHFAHIVAKNRVFIGKNVLIADRVFISDCTHQYADINVPIKKRRIENIGDVNIGDETWIGENVCVLGCSIGKHCVIGANSVVNKDIPDYTIAAGNPIRIIKKYNPVTNLWEKQNINKV